LSISRSIQKPSIVSLHGGTYDAEYFDASSEYSITRVTDPLGIPVIALSRPGYGTGMTLDFEVNETYAERQGKYINSTILPALWKEYGELSGASALVLLAHSFSAMMATATAGSYTGTEGYPLAGLITSGTGAEMNLTHI
jgi:pimeloyl-ACP methyl ester carboxylesterase